MGQILKTCRILIVDDNIDAAEMVAALLQAHGYATATAYGGGAALIAAEAFKPDVIFLDINMPGMDGYQAAAALKQQPSCAATRIVALTALSDEQSRARMTAVGFDAQLTKPASFEAMIRSFA